MVKMADFFTGAAEAFRSVLAALKIIPAEDDAVTENEVKDLIEQGTSDGTFEKVEQDMVDRIFRLGDQTAYSLMTARTQMLWLDLADSQRHNLRLIVENDTEVFPVGRESLDDFCGIIYAKEILNASLKRESLDLERFVHKPMCVPRSLEIFRLLEKFRAAGVNEAMVLDEYGGVVGFITIYDIMREILGEPDGQEALVKLRDAKSWYIDGLTDVDDFKERFDLAEETLPNEERDHFQTVGGFVTSLFGYIPKVGESVVFTPTKGEQSLRLEIVAMDRARIDKVLVRREENKDFAAETAAK